MEGMEDIRELAEAQVADVHVALKRVLEGQLTPFGVITAGLILTEFEVAQAKADAYAMYQGAKFRADRIEIEKVMDAARIGQLEGRNAEERKRLEDEIKFANPDVLSARTDTVSMRNMNDCLTNAHASVLLAVKMMLLLLGGHDENVV